MFSLFPVWLHHFLLPQTVSVWEFHSPQPCQDLVWSVFYFSLFQRSRGITFLKWLMTFSIFSCGYLICAYLFWWIFSNMLPTSLLECLFSSYFPFMKFFILGTIPSSDMWSTYTFSWSVACLNPLNTVFKEQRVQFEEV